MSDRAGDYAPQTEANARETLAYLSEAPKERKLIHDEADDRWFVYAFDADQVEVTSVPDPVAACLVGCDWVARRGSEARVDLEGPYGVYVITDDGREAAAS